MDSLIRRIKLRLHRQRTSPTGSRMVLAAFGKHPGWDDHMEDIGLDTHTLVAVKRILYVQGIGGNIEHGKWAELETKHLAIEFDHAFVWCRDGDIVAGRLWASRDGRGRTSYPMVVCIHCRKVPLRWVHDRILPRLGDIETACRSSASAGEVRNCLSQCQAGVSAIRETLSPTERGRAGGTNPIGGPAACPELGLDEEGLIRILYHIDREISVGSPTPTGKSKDRHSALARTPISGGRVREACTSWMELLLSMYGQERGVLVLVPREEAWLDIIVGEPGPAQLYCLRASAEALPLTTTVPYKISSEFSEAMRRRIENARR